MHTHKKLGISLQVQYPDLTIVNHLRPANNSSSVLHENRFFCSNLSMTFIASSSHSHGSLNALNTIPPGTRALAASILNLSASFFAKIPARVVSVASALCPVPAVAAAATKAPAGSMSKLPRPNGLFGGGGGGGRFVAVGVGVSKYAPGSPRPRAVKGVYTWYGVDGDVACVGSVTERAA